MDSDEMQAVRKQLIEALSDRPFITQVSPGEGPDEVWVTVKTTDDNFDVCLIIEQM